MKAPSVETMASVALEDKVVIGMTIEEMAKEIEETCERLAGCSECPLEHITAAKGECCYSAGANIERNYAFMFGKDIETKEGTPDNVNHPSHYETGKFECIDVMVETQGVEAVKNFCICNAFKYIYRHNNKNGVEDIKKAIWYLNKFIELEGEAP